MSSPSEFDVLLNIIAVSSKQLKPARANLTSTFGCATGVSAASTRIPCAVAKIYRRPYSFIFFCSEERDNPSARAARDTLP